jgi:predicted amidohydrolase
MFYFIFIDRHGNLLYTYAKIHTCDWITVEEITLPGMDFYTSQLDTGRGNMTIGSMICFDREHPESARINMLKGAEIILTPNGCYLDELRLTQFRIRGWENTLGVAMTNYPAPFYNGASVAYDFSGKQLVLATPDEGIYIADFDITAIREQRKKTIFGDAYRKPLHYGTLCDSSDANKFLCTLQKEPSFQGRDAFDRSRFV